MALKRKREIKNPNRKDMRVLDMSFSVSKENKKLLERLQEQKMTQKNR